jgi:hypothetical protein
VSTNRETARDALAALLETALVGTDLPVKTVTNTKVETLAGLTPLVSVLSAGSGRKRITFQGDQATFYLEVQVWVLQATSGWTNEQAEDALDEIESLIAGVYESARRTDEWELIEYTSRSMVVEIAVAGTPYYMERIPTTVMLMRS